MRVLLARVMRTGVMTIANHAIVFDKRRNADHYFIFIKQRRMAMA